MGAGFFVNASGTYFNTGIINVSSVSVGTTFIANTTGVFATSLNLSGGSVVVSSSGLNTTGAINATNGSFGNSTYNNVALYGSSNNSTGIVGISNSGVGVYGGTNTSVGVYGYSTTSGIGVTGISNTGIGISTASVSGLGLYVQSGTGTIAQFVNSSALVASINSTGFYTTGTVNANNLTTNSMTFSDSSKISTAYSLGTRNRLINGTMQVDQRNAGAAQTITAGAALAYTVDRWYAYCTGANVTGQRVAGTLANTYNYQFTGATSVTAINFAQRIEAVNSADLAGSTVTLSAYLSNSLLTTVTWTAYYANTTDTFGTLASPTVTQIATGTFTVSSSLTRYSTQISIPAAATTGLQIVFSVGAQTSGTLVIGSVQLEAGSIATPLERPTIQQMLAMCQRYYQVNYTQFGGAAASGVGFYWSSPLQTAMRVSPTIILSGTTYTGGTSGLGSASAPQYIIWNASNSTAAGIVTSSFSANSEL